jgi:hypothetical protein
MGIAQTVKRKLIALTAAFFQPFTYLAVQMKRVAQNTERDIFLLEKRKQAPKILVQYQIAAVI